MQRRNAVCLFIILGIDRYSGIICFRVYFIKRRWLVNCFSLFRRKKRVDISVSSTKRKENPEYLYSRQVPTISTRRRKTNDWSAELTTVPE